MNNSRFCENPECFLNQYLAVNGKNTISIPLPNGEFREYRRYRVQYDNADEIYYCGSCRHAFILYMNAVIKSQNVYQIFE